MEKVKRQKCGICERKRMMKHLHQAYGGWRCNDYAECDRVFSKKCKEETITCYCRFKK